MLIVADKQILCASCGVLVGLRTFNRGTVPDTVLMKDRYVVPTADRDVLYCNSTCKERAQV